MLCIPIFGPLVLTIRLIFAWLKRPDMQFHKPEPVLGGTNRELVWWHVPISLKYGWLKPFSLNDVSCTLLLDGKGETELCFRPLQAPGPEHRINIHWGDVRQIPVCARSETDNFPLGFTAPYILLHGAIVDNWLLKPGVARITDGNHYFTFNNLINLDGGKSYGLLIQMKIGQTRYAEKRYTLNVPACTADNRAFALSEHD